MSVYQDLVPETVPIKKNHVNIDLILNGYGAICFIEKFLTVNFTTGIINGHHNFAYTFQIVYRYTRITLKRTSASFTRLAIDEVLNLLCPLSVNYS